MGLYANHILPWLIDRACSAEPVARQREKVVPLAEGTVLEIGIGSGLNLPYYDAAKVEKVIGLDPAEEMLAKARARAAAVAFPVEHLALAGEEIPLDGNSVDTVLVTYTLCTIVDVAAALSGMRRVLKDGGRLIFCEHGLAPDAGVRRVQNLINPFWRRIGGGCNVNRDIPGLLLEGGFAIDSLDTMYLPGTPRFGGFNYWGTARVG
ncbi:MAG: class I SAM-dependent methyltransferase [Minwuiales bacterium]|nr:class I SAM-dependent methyltransferase [Minwuiales bacterium]